MGGAVGGEGLSGFAKGAVLHDPPPLPRFKVSADIDPHIAGSPHSKDPIRYPEYRKLPYVMKFLQQHAIPEISVGKEHAVALTEGGRIFASTPSNLPGSSQRMGE